GLVLDVGRVDGDAAGLLLRGLVDLVEGHELRRARLGQHLGDRGGQRRLAVIDVPDRPDVAVRLGPLELRLRHRSLLRVVAGRSSAYAPTALAMISSETICGTGA